jgi:DNA-binding NarL/FixJ family response regulator
MATLTKILVADDNFAARNEILNILSGREDWVVCGQAADGQEAVEIAQASCPDVAVLDVSMPRKDGIQAAKELMQSCPNIIVVSQSFHDTDQLIEELKQIGVKAYVQKARLRSELVPAIEAVLKGQTVFPTTRKSADRSGSLD